MNGQSEKPSGNGAMIAAGVGAGAFVLFLLMGYGFVAAILLGLVLAGAVAAALAFGAGQGDAAATKTADAPPASSTTGTDTSSTTGAAKPSPETPRDETAHGAPEFEADASAETQDQTPDAGSDGERAAKESAGGAPASEETAPAPTPGARGDLGEEATGERAPEPSGQGDAEMEGERPAGRIQASKPLPGQDDLAARKGSWRYEGGNTRADEGAAPRNGETEGVQERRPAAMDAPRGGRKDDLQKIRGIGPKLEDMLNEMGIYHYEQIAGWSQDELRWVDGNLEGFKGRASRDEWVTQARAMAPSGQA
ncbi:hypothetical protein [Profundibacterium mesophilum]|uniref:NADH ubiquinone oxidoreductase chain E n=1 Tax=Profundibacterium mesophilum KAUST100406-0324 TaxID=1037889 RepID=A0A921NPY6_9RHOB|nr:hypothetical protein [Profundibacterium mesophilum]KAF0674867.1 NADH ubiquinone oxidoreductase chain E [Profundibacterium mesophilum KAUST100406-0324]